MIRGNTTAILQKKMTVKNEIGESVPYWMEVEKLIGLLDLATGDSKHTTFLAKVQESSHIFICDYKKLDCTCEDVRMNIDGKIYEVKLIDDPCNLHKHLEIYLRYLGGDNE